jgi:hypothetical protein
LNGSGTDADGTISSYGWIKIAGPSSGTIVTSNTATTSLTNLVQGVYNFELTVTDNNGAASKDSVQVTVYAALNKAPAANAGADKSITLPANSLTLNGSGTDADGTISSFGWTKIAGPSGGTIVNAGAATTAITSLAKGIYKYMLTVKDNNGLSGTDTIQITVNPTRHRTLVANAGANKVIALPTSTTMLSGSVIEDNAAVSSYSWTKLQGPSSGIISNPNTAVSLVTDLSKGDYKFEFTVTDSAGHRAKDTLQISVVIPEVPNNAATFSVYPNPVQNIVNLDIFEPGFSKGDKKFVASVINFNGRVVIRKLFTTSTSRGIFKLDLSGINDGFYVIRLIFEDGTILNQKVIKLGIGRK